jgi:hypothetical protein
MPEAEMDHHVLERVEKATPCVDCTEVIAAGEWAAPRLVGINPDATDISEMICLTCILMSAAFAVLSVGDADVVL